VSHPCKRPLTLSPDEGARLLDATTCGTQRIRSAQIHFKLDAAVDSARGVDAMVTDSESGGTALSLG